MNINISAFNRPLKQKTIDVGGEDFYLSARFLEIDLPLPTITNLDLPPLDSNHVAVFDGMLLLEIQSTDYDLEVCGFAIYGKYGDAIILTDLQTKMHRDEFTAIFHDWAERLSGLEVSIPSDLDIIRDALFVTEQTPAPAYASRTGIIEVLLQTHFDIQREKKRGS